MDVPLGHEQGSSNKVCQLKKALYSLKQSLRAWFERLSRVVKRYGYFQRHSDHTMFYKSTDEGKIIVLIVYVDDMILTGNDHVEIESLKVLAKELEVKDLGALRYFLGMEIARNKNEISVSQRKYTLDFLKETGMLGCSPNDIPINSRHKIDPAEKGDLVEKGRYQQLVGKLIYLSHTRPDIAFVVSTVSLYMHSPYEAHMNAIYKILQYLKGIPRKGLHVGQHDQFKIKAFMDADWAGSIEDRRSTSSYCTFVFGNLVTWRSKKKKCGGEKWC